ncbi:MAG: hypothetical protein MJZ41_10025 [Bacteroidaceae bacterium]|nr:hypothetical protein [Bacteroidaceae bacterium]
MRLPLLVKVYMRLSRGWGRLSPEAQMLVRQFVESQKKDGGYVNAGGKVEKYYTQFGQVLEAVFSPMRLVSHPVRKLTVDEALGKDTVYGHFFRFILDDLHFKGQAMDFEMQDVMTTNAVCCILAMQHQTGRQADGDMVRWLLDRQDESGGFYSSEVAPVPDLLTTAVALFTLRLVGAKAKSARDFVDAHWMDDGGFAPTIFDEYSDVEYVFYGLLALGSDG